MWPAVLIIINLMSFTIMAMDKRRSIHGGRRMPEKNLIILAVLLGAPGIYLGMLIFRHKTQKPSFKIGVPLLILANSWVYWSLLSKVPQ